ncbi:hypothetical protein CXG81DRAFT_9150 [Caulochytrium protostelioides]|uniref:Peroxisomal membrane protein PEX16 n=1 Tax=Caulochytrium protostelioides TaxID=1555241 RepID=A0A4P9XDY8_9FUNG|nr:hypothetical protein CXG81DRAFT_9150 [Caulochytrium protostelioides]|eukprot:RKP03702.1 hypothetical protein CXG81DRAFT_9150 [Caulochytrium protostelioides]
MAPSPPPPPPATARWTEQYTALVRQHAAEAHSLEGALRSISYLLPGKFAGADLISEALFSAVNLLGLAHDRILAQRFRDRAPAAVVSPFNRYIEYQHERSPAFRKTAQCLTLVQTLEVLAEMATLFLCTRGAGRHAVGRGVHRLLTALIKLALRANLLRLSGGRMLPHAVMPERDYDPSQQAQADAAAAGGDGAMAAAAADPALALAAEPPVWKGRRSGRSHLPLGLSPRHGAAHGADGADGADPLDAYMATRALPDATRSPLRLLPSLAADRRRLQAEYAYLLRPVIYVLMIMRYGRRSWKPWLLSLTRWILSLIRLRGLRIRMRRDIAPLESQEYKKRLWLLLYYFLRMPLYDVYTKPRLDRFANALSTKPLLSLFSGLFQDYQPLWEQYYFTTSGF